jgi:hypothetical protein
MIFFGLFYRQNSRFLAEKSVNVNLKTVFLGFFVNFLGLFLCQVYQVYQLFRGTVQQK